MNINFENKVIFYFASLIFFLAFFLNYKNYDGSITLFFLYQFSSYVLFLILIKKNISAFEFFFYLFLLLSFWFRFNCMLFFDTIKISEGDFDLKISNYDNAIFIIIITFISCICASIIRIKINKKLKPIKRLKINSKFKKFYKQHRFYILFIYLFTLIVIYLINQYYDIYFKGLKNENISRIINFIYSYLFIYGLAVITSIYIYTDYLIFKNKSFFLLGLFEAFFTQLNILSRSFIFSFLAYFRGFLILASFDKIKYSKFFLLKIASIILIFFYISISLVTELRSIKFYDHKKHELSKTKIETEITKPTPTLAGIVSLAVQRWVGIDALLAVSQSKKLSFDFFVSSWSEKINFKKKSFYVENFYKKFQNHEFENKNVNRVITPGIVAFLYYSGSPIFVFFCILILVLICSYIERLFFCISYGNIILSNIIGYALSIRFIHFGYVPANTFNFLVSFFVTLIFVFVITKLISK